MTNDNNQEFIMKHTTINTIILATALSVAGLTTAIAATTTESGATDTPNCIYKEDGRGKHNGDKRRGGKGNKTMGFQKLDLTAEQKTAIEAIMETNKTASEALRSAHKLEMQALLDTPTFDKEQATTLIEQREAQRTDKKLTMMQVKHEIYQLLTDEQKAQYNELKEKRQGKDKRHGKRNGKTMKCNG